MPCRKSLFGAVHARAHMLLARTAASVQYVRAELKIAEWRCVCVMPIDVEEMSESSGSEERCFPYHSGTLSALSLSRLSSQLVSAFNMFFWRSRSAVFKSTELLSFFSFRIYF